MWQRLIRRLAATVLAVTVITSSLWAQNRPADRLQHQNQPPEELERGPPVPQYALAFVATILVMLILCMPSRKRVSQS